MGIHYMDTIGLVTIDTKEKNKINDANDILF